MKNKVFTLLALALLSALLLTGCGETDDQHGVSTTSVSTNASSEPSETSDVTDIADAVTYRSDLLWHESFIQSKPIPEDDMMPPEGELYLRFSPFEDTPANEDKRYAVHFRWYDSADGDAAALTAYLADLGIEEVGEAGGFEFPVYAVTRAELESLDCVAMQETMGISTEHGIDVHITSNDREHPCTSSNTCE